MFALALTPTVAGTVAKVFLECWRGFRSQGEEVILQTQYYLHATKAAFIIMAMFLLKHRRKCFLYYFECDIFNYAQTD